MSKKRITWKIEKRKLADLKPHPKNPRQFTEKGMKDLENSINSIGFMQPININQDGTILSGHARTLKLQQMGEIEVDVYVPDRLLTPKQEEEVLVRANANTAGQWDFDILANEFEDFELEEWGLEIPQIEDADLSDKNKEIDIDSLDTSECKIVFKFDAIMYESIIARIKKLKEENNFETNEVMFLELLQKYEL
jgi:hypothetical protein